GPIKTSINFEPTDSRFSFVDNRSCLGAVMQIGRRCDVLPSGLRRQALRYPGKDALMPIGDGLVRGNAIDQTSRNANCRAGPVSLATKS
ncbi:MAG TPA: hypothetical protein VKC60_06120, partial [Opitutaceae bacterium]|nr:hypothetical protein [Opitutaceae bacterium]